MKISTILPTSYLFLEAESDYHLCLAHQVKKDPDYADFFWRRAANGAFVIMDNGIVETGSPLSIEELVSLADLIECQEMVLPDSIGNADETIERSFRALRSAGPQHICGLSLMAVPQGSTPDEWIECVREMLLWNVDTIGITRFLVPKVFPSRSEALKRVPELIASDKDIHMLGCPGHPREIAEIDKAFPDRIRGVDSGIAAIYTQVSTIMRNDGQSKPNQVIDLDTIDLNEEILKRNIAFWKDECQWKR